MSTRSLVAFILIWGFTSTLLAQAPPAPPKAGPEHKKLEYFVGKWIVESEIKANGRVADLNGRSLILIGIPDSLRISRRTV